jgi:hypothetical protein
MKTEFFDEAIRKKLEGLPQKVTDQEVDKVFRYVTRHRGPFYTRIGGHGLIYTALVGVIVGLVWWNLSMRTQNSTSDKISNDPKKSITKTISNPQTNQSITPATQKETDIPQPEPTTQPNTTPSTLKETPLPIALPSHQQTTPSSNDEEIAQAELDKPLPQQTNLNREFITVSKLQARNQVAVFSFTTNPPSFGLPIHKNNKLVINLGREPQTPTTAQNSTKKAKKSSEPTPYKPARKTSQNLLASKAQRNANQFYMDLEARALAGIEINNSQFGISTLFEVIAAKHWGLAAGVKYMLNKGEDFRDGADFMDRRSKPIHEAFGEHPELHGKISDLQISSAIVQLPIQFTYYYPLKNNFTVSLALSSNFDVYNSTNIRLMNRPDRDSLDHQVNLKVAPPLQFFNNLIVSAGVQKRWNRWAIQATPYLGKQVVHVDYRREDWFYGLGVNLCYYLNN